MGDYDFDSSRFISQGFGGGGSLNGETTPCRLTMITTRSGGTSG